LFAICLVTILLMISHSAFAGGLYLSQVNSPASLGTAGVNNVVNNFAPDAAYTNPAGMTGIDKDEIMPGFQLLVPIVKFEPTTAEAGGNDGGNAGETALVPGVSLVKVLSDDWRFGFAITAPLGGGVDYGDSFVGRYAATRSVISGLGITPSVGYKINDKVSVGAGISAIYSNMDLDVAINRPGALPDGFVRIDKIDDWSAQGILGLTWQVTDKAMLGLVYRTKSEVNLGGDLKFEGAPLINEITGNPDSIGIDFDYAQVIAVGLAYDVSDKMRLVFDLDWEDWSEFSDNYVSIQGGSLTTTIKRNWEDTWHVGAAVLYKIDEESYYSAGIGYDTSPVEDEDRTADLPLDEQLKLGFSYGKHRMDKFDYAVGLGFIWLGDGKMDQVAQGARYAGKFDSNYLISLGGNVRYFF
jgi:long-chain fatty acid transport protein